VGQQPKVQLNFQQKLNSAQIEELSGTGVDILQVQAVRSDGRKQRVIYSFGRGNEDGTFEINSNNGLVRLQNPQFIDFEARREFNLTIIGHAAGSENLYAYTQCIISVQDKNDNKPRFTQQVYFARTWEGNNKGTYVSQVVAVDRDSIENERLYYQIVDGNLDGAFAIEQQYSGIIKTNIVLDREIRDHYDLTVSVTDEGTPPKTGYAKVVITIIDINDNRPQFPRAQPIVISEAALPGSRIGTIQANDIDSHPHLTYSFLKGGNPLNAFSIDKFSGVLSMAKKTRP
jgi:protocadherin-16/23